MSAMNIIKSNIFSTPMPEMPPVLREVWQVAFMYRRKYSNPKPGADNVESYFSAAWSDLEFISQTYGNNETVRALMMEVYLDIERQWKVVQARNKDV